MLNKVILIGRLTRDPELRYTLNGVAVSTFTLAVDRPYSNQNGHQETDFINIVTFRTTAENSANYLKKGRLVAIEGQLQVRSYNNQEGRKVTVYEVVANTVHYLDRKEPQTEQSVQTPLYNDSQIEINNDDLPF